MLKLLLKSRQSIDQFWVGLVKLLQTYLLHCLCLVFHAGVCGSTVPGASAETVSERERSQRCVYWRPWLVQPHPAYCQLLAGDSETWAALLQLVLVLRANVLSVYSRVVCEAWLCDAVVTCTDWCTAANALSGAHRVSWLSLWLWSTICPFV